MTGREIKPGGIHDPVAQNIRNQMNRDAMPTKEEAQREHRQWLSERGCTVCDEADPDELTEVMPYIPSCKSVQAPRDIEPEVFCYEHERRPRDFWWANMIYRARNRDAVAIVTYECGNVEFVDEPEVPTETVEVQTGWDDSGDGDPTPVHEEVEQEIPTRYPPRPDAPIHCRCGEEVKDITYIEQ